jgi:hypothetical protein
MFVGFLLDGDREITISVVTTIFVPFQITLVVFFIWLAVKPKFLYYLMTALQDQEEENMETMNPENVHHLVADLYRMIQDRRDQGEVMDSQETRFIEFLYLMQQQHYANVEANANNGVVQDVLQSLPLYDHDDQVNGPGTCTICITDFVQGDKIRSLPCSHRFHQGCVDTWLSKNKTCPNCNGQVEQQVNGQTTNDATTTIDTSGETTVEIPLNE